MDESLEDVMSDLTSFVAFESGAIFTLLEQFLLTMVSNQSRYDQWLLEFTESEERGRVLFFDEFDPFNPEASGADCAHCHSGLDFLATSATMDSIDAVGIHARMANSRAT